LEWFLEFYCFDAVSNAEFNNKGDYMPTKKGFIWINKTLRAYNKWQAKGSYSTWRGDRHFILTDTITKQTRVFESPAVAEREEWKKL